MRCVSEGCFSLRLYFRGVFYGEGRQTDDNILWVSSRRRDHEDKAACSAEPRTNRATMMVLPAITQINQRVGFNLPLSYAFALGSNRAGVSLVSLSNLTHMNPPCSAPSHSTSFPSGRVAPAASNTPLPAAFLSRYIVHNIKARRDHNTARYYKTQPQIPMNHTFLHSRTHHKRRTARSQRRVVCVHQEGVCGPLLVSPLPSNSTIMLHIHATFLSDKHTFSPHVRQLVKTPSEPTPSHP